MKPVRSHKPSPLARGLIVLAIALSASLLSLTPAGTALEEKLGLDLLFWLRGEQKPPAEVVVVAIDRNSAAVLGAPDEPERWPRTLHAALIRRLQEAGAGLIVFNVFFGTGQPSEDGAMAEAMREADNVVLTDYLKLRQFGGGIYVEALVEPEPILAEAALATAPFLLPQTAEARRFLTRYGERETLPVTLLHLYALRYGFDELVGCLRKVDSSFAEFLENRRLELLKSYGIALFQSEWARRCASDPSRSALRLLLETPERDVQLYFNHYGPAGAIPRVSYHELIGTPKERITLAGKVVFVGFSEDFQPESTEGLFYSPFSPVSSVELAATAFANMLRYATIRPAFSPGGEFLWLLAWGSILGLWGHAARLRIGATGVFAMSLGYLAVASYLFRSEGVWLPLSLPLFLQAPAALSISLWNHHAQRTRDHRTMESVMQRFIPVEVVSHLVRETEQGRLDSFGHLTFGVCLASDAGQYTALAETLEPMALTNLINAYYGELFPAVIRNQGWISDVVGDAMMAIWTGSGDPREPKRGALRAALELHRAAAAFERSRGIKLPLRIGVHCGEMRVGLVGASDHGEFRATGDTVNTAARLEALNKLLGTQILVSAALLADLEDFMTRTLGSFVLAGKTQPVAVCELMGEIGEGAVSEDLLGRFREALGLFQAGSFGEAQALFAQLAADYPQDGPTRFYLDAAKRYAAAPKPNDGPTLIQTEKPAPGQAVWK